MGDFQVCGRAPGQFALGEVAPAAGAKDDRSGVAPRRVALVADVKGASGEEASNVG